MGRYYRKVFQGIRIYEYECYVCVSGHLEENMCIHKHAHTQKRKKVVEKDVQQDTTNGFSFTMENSMEIPIKD